MDDFGSYYLKAVNIAGKSNSKLELIQLLDDPVTASSQTTSKIHSLDYNHMSFETNTQDRLNKTHVILSKIYNSKNKSMKNNLKVEDSSEDGFGKDDFNKHRSIQKKILTSRVEQQSQVDSFNIENKLSSTRMYHLEQMENFSLRLQTNVRKNPLIIVLILLILIFNLNFD